MSADTEPERIVGAWIEAAGYLSELRGTPTVVRRGAVWLEEGEKPFTNPVPRSFEYTKMFYALADDRDGVLSAVAEALDSPAEEHVLNAFGADGEHVAREFAVAGYQLAWVFSLFGFEPVGELPRPHLDDPNWTLRPVRDAADVDRINAEDPEFASHPELVGDPRVYEVMVLDAERAIAKGCLIEGAPGIVHVLGMFTVPDYRRRGLARTVIEALHLEAKRRGVELCVLNPSLMAAQHGVYPALGYRTLMQGARLIPKRTPRAGDSPKS